MEKSGCYYFSIGIESGSQRILNLVNKRLSIKMIRKQVSLVRKTTKIKVVGFFIVGYPSETEEEILKTIRFVRDLDLDRVMFFFYSPVPGDEITKELIAKGKLDLKKTWGKSLSFEPDNISARKLKSLYICLFLYLYKT